MMDDLDPEIIPELRDEVCRLIGLRLLKTVPIFEIGGWSTFAGGRPYLHGGSPDADVFLAFVDWVRTGSADAKATLLRAADLLQLDSRSQLENVGHLLETETPAT